MNRRRHIKRLTLIGASAGAAALPAATLPASASAGEINQTVCTSRAPKICAYVSVTAPTGAGDRLGLSIQKTVQSVYVYSTQLQPNTVATVTPTLYSMDKTVVQRFTSATRSNDNLWGWSSCSQGLGGTLPNPNAANPFKTPCHLWSGGNYFGVLVELKTRSGARIYTTTTSLWQISSK